MEFILEKCKYYWINGLVAKANQFIRTFESFGLAMEGELIEKGSLLAEQSNIINTGKYNNGIYQLIIKISSQNKLQKIIIQH